MSVRYIYIYIHTYMSLNITAFHMTGWHEIVQTFIPRHFLLHGNMVHGIVRCPLFRVAGWFNSIDLVFFGAQLNFAFDLVTTSHWIGNQNRKKRLIPTGRTGESCHQTKPTSWTKTPSWIQKEQHKTNLQCHICFFSFAIYSTWHDRPWKAVIDGGRWGFWGQLQICISIPNLQKNAFSKGVFLVKQFCRDLYSLNTDCLCPPGRLDRNWAMCWVRISSVLHFSLGGTCISWDTAKTWETAYVSTKGVVLWHLEKGFSRSLRVILQWFMDTWTEILFSLSCGVMKFHVGVYTVYIYI